MLKNFGRGENVFFFFMFHSHIIFLTFRNCLLNLQKDFLVKNSDKWCSLYDNSTTCTSYTSNKISLDVELRKFLYRKFPLFSCSDALCVSIFEVSPQGIVPTLSNTWPESSVTDTLPSGMKFIIITRCSNGFSTEPWNALLKLH